MTQLFTRLLDTAPVDAQVIDPLFHRPHNAIEQLSRPTIAEAAPGEVGRRKSA